MKTKILTVLTGAMLVASLSYAAPLTNLDQGETKAGYNHYNLDVSGLDVNDDSFYLEHGISPKLNLGVERNTYSVAGGSSHTTDVYAHYKLGNNLQLIVGDRNYSGGTDKVFYGVGANVNLTPRLDGYATVTTSSLADEWQTGVNYRISNQAALHVGYKSYKEDHSPTMDGFGFGVDYQF
ncbi:MAG TPA: hypothetical protein PKA10_18190 [Selenomonadales bacterium]|nr:hypothetical protein [Selenomonadales bacterium]